MQCGGDGRAVLDKRKAGILDAARIGQRAGIIIALVIRDVEGRGVMSCCGFEPVEHLLDAQL